MKRLALALVLICAAALTSSAAGIDPFSGYVDLRSQSTGGFHTALADDFSVLFTNPAGLAAAKPAFAASRLDLALKGPIFDLANIALGGTSDLATAALDFLTANGYQLYTGFDLSGPISIGYVGDGLGFGVFQRTKLIVDVAGMNSVKISLAEDFLIDGGYAFRIALGKANFLDIGLVAKGYVRASTGVSGDVLTLMGLISDPTALLGQELALTTGIGLDAGLRWNWNEVVAAGLACTDLYSPAKVTRYSDATSFITDPASAFVASSDAALPRKLNVGLMWKPNLGAMTTVFDSITLTADYLDILDLFSILPRNPILNVSLGCEVRILDILTLRAGLKDALPQAGAEFSLGFMQIGVAAWGAELGSEPGQRSLYNLELAFDFVY